MTLIKAFVIGTFCPPLYPVICYFYALMAEEIHEVQKWASYVRMNSSGSQTGVMDCSLFPQDTALRPGVTDVVVALHSLTVSSSKGKNVMRLVWSNNLI